MGYYDNAYRLKLRTPEDAVRIVKSGDWVDYTTGLGKPVLLDRALAKRRDELYDVKIRGNLINGPIEVVECDPTKEHFIYHTWHCSPYERSLCDKELCYFIPMVFHLNSEYYKHFLTVNVAMVSVTPMDKHGYFNFSTTTGVTGAILRKADVVILEVNERLPKLLGGYDECIHIDDVDMVVEGEHDPLPDNQPGPVGPIDREIAGNLFPYMKDGMTLQLGIGDLPNAIGTMLADSDIRDVSMHTELCSDAYLELFKAGKLTNRYKTINYGKGVLGIAIGSREMYEWLDENPSIAAYPLAYVNKPTVIEQIDNMVSVNSCVAVDLYGQISSESAGIRQISGTGGQLDFLVGAAEARGGKAFICVNSTFTDRKGVKHSNIVPRFGGDIITSPRSQAYFIATEYGVVNLVGRSTWERAELLISIAHPDFRDELIKAAEAQKIWRRSNR
ncbi:MAG: butyryl-CoA:acetate CoA-transferase [Eubacterium sp.]|nr:butyryl-CoA:acetate CoA-transferase [Eubacterium sp.]